MTLQLYHRAYITPVRGYKMRSLADSKCFRCSDMIGTMLHCVWECPMVQTLWNKTRLFTTNHLVNYVPFNPTWAVFQFVDPDDVLCIPGSRKLLYMISATGIKTILHTWNHASSPPFKLFSEKLSHLMNLDWMEASLKKRNTREKFF